MGGDVVTFEGMREFRVAYLTYDQQMHVANDDGRDRVLARRRELVDSSTQIMVADEFHDGKPSIDLSEKLKKPFAGVDVQQPSDMDFCHQIFLVLKMDASVPVDSRVFMQKRALRKYLADCGHTDVVKPGCRQYTLKHGKVLVEATSTGIKPLEFRRKVEEMRFNLVVHDPDALFNIYQYRRDQAVIETNDAARRQTASRRDAG